MLCRHYFCQLQNQLLNFKIKLYILFYFFIQFFFIITFLLVNLNKKMNFAVLVNSPGIQPCSTEVSVNVKVIDKSMPVFDKQFYAVSVREDIQIHSPLPLTIRAESPLNRKLIYSITAGNAREQFAVDFNTGEFYFRVQVQCETLLY